MSGSRQPVAAKDIWYMNSYNDYTMIYDPIEPQLVAVAPMAGGTYKIGDFIYKFR